MAYSNEDKDKLFDELCKRIGEGESLRHVLLDDHMPGCETFYKWIDSDKDKAIQYARATECRADAIFEEILEISNHSEEDHTPFTGANVIQRDRLKIDARKWILSKMMPKKYGDKLDVTTDGEKINEPKKIIVKIKRNEDKETE